MGALLITGGRVVDPVASLDAVCDLRIRNGIVVEIGKQLESDEGERAIDVTGAVVAPGFIDMHVHLREPGFPQKETIATGTEAAVRGGFSAVACMPNTDPALDSSATLRWLGENVRRSGRCRVYPIGAITIGRKGREPCDFAALAKAGAVGFSDDGDTVADASVLRDAALHARHAPGVFISHCDPEDFIVARDLSIAGETGNLWHIAHLSTRDALEIVRNARAHGTQVTCEATPHHLTFTADDARRIGPAARVNPPLRREEDVAALRQGVRDGTIDALASDHAPHTEAEKNDPAAPAPGFSGLEIAVGAYADALPDLPVARFVELLSANPARILGIAGGTLRPGAVADVTIFAERSWIVDPSTFASKGRSTPFAGRRLPRMVLATIVGGELRYSVPELGIPVA
ncbi:MAG TPA: dihydroorotase [Candidatus Cybelea sp.]|nr:dihydroorotase [Candidatus Cybelea sp.]